MLIRYKSVEPDVLFTAFESTVSEYKYDFGQGVTVTSFMREWTENAGYPVINVEKKNNTFIITQVCILFYIDKFHRSQPKKKTFSGKIPNRYTGSDNRSLQMVCGNHLHYRIEQKF